jgi:hypothetical protein
MGRALNEAKLTNKRVTNSVGDWVASREVKRWMSTKCSIKWRPRLQGQQVARLFVKWAAVQV